MDQPAEQAVYAQVGEDGFRRLTEAFYRRVETDTLLAPMYRRAAEDAGETGLDNARRRLSEFLVQRFGGPGRYSLERGHPRLRMRHMPFAIDTAARDRWLSLMNDALDEAQIPPAPAATMRAVFAHIADFMRNSPG